mmetsp:Transcript_98536/g.294262  ORF Transcript_98536/g.294262 Transcript_98536/m.294262 type:complete len:237 (+) Transcript_98536:160-870(+)
MLTVRQHREGLVDPQEGRTIPADLVRVRLKTALPVGGADLVSIGCARQPQLVVVPGHGLRRAPRGCHTHSARAAVFSRRRTRGSNRLVAASVGVCLRLLPAEPPQRPGPAQLPEAGGRWLPLRRVHLCQTRRRGREVPKGLHRTPQQRNQLCQALHSGPNGLSCLWLRAILLKLFELIVPKVIVLLLCQQALRPAGEQLAQPLCKPHGLHRPRAIARLPLLLALLRRGLRRWDSLY